MKSLAILGYLLRDASFSIGADTARDWICIQSRSKDEGLSFLTITLPLFSSWLEQSIEEGRALTSIYKTFKAKGGSKSVLPCFLHGLTELIFDARTGDLREDADPTAVSYIRGICNVAKKVKIPCSSARNRDAILGFIETDRALPEHISLDTFAKSVASVYFEEFYFLDSHEQCLPRHGPGATVEGLWGNQKFTRRDYYARWKGLFDPIDLYGQSIRQSTITVIDEDEELPCSLVLVPKTMKSPRLIAKEPVAMQYAQQYTSARIIRAMGTNKMSKHLDFCDQSKNRRSALIGSRDGSLATIDLSEASDRVSFALVKALFSFSPMLFEYAAACRSRFVSLPGGAVLPLKKYSTSGSALTFPVETLVFFLLSLSAMVKKSTPSHGESMRSLIHRLAQTVSVYGDDIVVPAEFCSCVIDYLETYGLKVNRKKTFWKGLFRESCGGDYFKGYDVTPVYLRYDPSKTRPVRDGIVSLISTCNQFFFAGYWRTADYMRRMLDRVFPLPLVQRTSPGSGLHTYQDAYEFTKYTDDFGIRVKTWTSRTKPVDNLITGLDALLKHQVSIDVQEDSEHLNQSVPKFRSVTRLSWVTPY